MSISVIAQWRLDYCSWKIVLFLQEHSEATCREKLTIEVGQLYRLSSFRIWHQWKYIEFIDTADLVVPINVYGLLPYRKIVAANLTWGPLLVWFALVCLGCFNHWKNIMISCSWFTVSKSSNLRGWGMHPNYFLSKFRQSFPKEALHYRLSCRKEVATKGEETDLDQRTPPPVCTLVAQNLVFVRILFMLFLTWCPLEVTCRYLPHSLQPEACITVRRFQPQVWRFHTFRYITLTLRAKPNKLSDSGIWEGGCWPSAAHYNATPFLLAPSVLLKRSGAFFFFKSPL